ncbi:MAG: hypothetical protein J6W75_12470 [Bacteroidaceae bacterium]|nr:hypothetical protein [Bacteroidaceae bacterium]
MNNHHQRGWGWILVLFAILLTGCTLSMEEWQVAEEDKGFDEPETVEYEYGTLTYQYKEGVRSITENVQQYIIRYENLPEEHIILYFMDNTPKDWVPQKGDLLTSMCTLTLPFGLNHRVTSVVKADGMYKVECEPATRDDIFEDLVFEFDADYHVPNVAAYDSLALDSLGIDPNDLIMEDFSMMEEHYGQGAMTRAGYHSRLRWRDTPAFRKLREAGLVSLGGTRAGDDDDDKPKTTEDDKDESQVFFLSNLGITVNFGQNVSLSLGGSITTHEVEHVWMHEDKKKDYRKQVTTTSNYTDYDVDVRLGVSKNFAKDPEKWNPKDLQEMMGILKVVKDNLSGLPKELKQHKKPLTFVNIRAPIPGTVFFLVLKLEGGVTLEGGAHGYFEATVHDPVTKSTYVYDKGNESSIPRKNASKDEKDKKGIVKAGYTELKDMSLVGDMKLEVWIRPAIGVELSATGLGCDLGFKASVGAKAKVDIASFTGSKTVVMPSTPDGLEFYLSGELAATAYWSPAGFNLFEAKYTFWNPYKKLGEIIFSPVVNKGNVNSSIKELGDDKRKFHVDYSFSETWLGVRPISKHVFLPRLRVYHGAFTGKCLELKTGDGLTEQELAKRTTYEFDFDDDDLLSKEATYICVPCIYDFNDDRTYEFRDAAKVFGDGGPIIKFLDFKQRYGTTASMYLSQKTDLFFDQEIVDQYYKVFRDRFGLKKGDEKYVRFFEFGAKYEVKNINLYKKWGLKVKICVHSSGRTLIEKDIDVVTYDEDTGSENSKTPGKKTAVISFVTNYDDDLDVYLTPYVYDINGERTDFPTTGPKFLDGHSFYKKFDWSGDWGSMDL